MRTAWVSLALLGLAGCASSMDRTPQPVVATMILPQHRMVEMADMAAQHNRMKVPLKPMTASQSAARMN